MSAIFINNNWQDGQDAEFTSLNPANQDIIWQGKSASSKQVSQAIESAQSAFKSWAILDIEQRKKYIEKYIQILTNNKDQYAKAISLENGKPLWEAKIEVAGMIGKYAASMNSYESRTGYTESLAAVNSRLTHRPIGVMAVFGPFNFPGHLPNGHIIPALLAGNTVVFKPSDLTPICGELIVKYWLEAGLPKGVINLVQGGSEVGKNLVASADINGVLFTGSYHVGKIIHQSLAGRPEVLLALELGGNNPLIIDNDINNIDAAVYNTIQSAFITSGQRCTCARRLYVPETDLGNNFISRLIDVTSKIALSDGINNINLDNGSEPFMGPVVSLTSKNNILNFKDYLVKNRSAKELLEPKSISDSSALITPGIYAMPKLNLNFNSELDQECFGPLLQIYRYNKFDEAITAANNTEYGLSAGLLSDNKNNFDKFYQLIRAGIVNWNRPTTGAAGNLPFGGIKHSGNYKPSAAYAADYCAYPMASQYSENLELPEDKTPGIKI